MWSKQHESGRVNNVALPREPMGTDPLVRSGMSAMKRNRTSTTTTTTKGSNNNRLRAGFGLPMPQQQPAQPAVALTREEIEAIRHDHPATPRARAARHKLRHAAVSDPAIWRLIQAEMRRLKLHTHVGAEIWLNTKIMEETALAALEMSFDGEGGVDGRVSPGGSPGGKLHPSSGGLGAPLHATPGKLNIKSPFVGKGDLGGEAEDEIVSNLKRLIRFGILGGKTGPSANGGAPPPPSGHGGVGGAAFPSKMGPSRPSLGGRAASNRSLGSGCGGSVNLMPDKDDRIGSALKTRKVHPNPRSGAAPVPGGVSVPMSNMMQRGSSAPVPGGKGGGKQQAHQEVALRDLLSQVLSQVDDVDLLNEGAVGSSDSRAKSPSVLDQEDAASAHEEEKKEVEYERESSFLSRRASAGVSVNRTEISEANIPLSDDVSLRSGRTVASVPQPGRHGSRRRNKPKKQGGDEEGDLSLLQSFPEDVLSGKKAKSSAKAPLRRSKSRGRGDNARKGSIPRGDAPIPPPPQSLQPLAQRSRQRSRGGSAANAAAGAGGDTAALSKGAALILGNFGSAPAGGLADDPSTDLDSPPSSKEFAKAAAVATVKNDTVGGDKMGPARDMSSLPRRKRTTSRSPGVAAKVEQRGQFPSAA